MMATLKLLTMVLLLIGVYSEGCSNNCKPEQGCLCVQTDDDVHKGVGQCSKIIDNICNIKCARETAVATAKYPGHVFAKDKFWSNQWEMEEKKKLFGVPLKQCNVHYNCICKFKAMNNKYEL